MTLKEMLNKRKTLLDTMDGFLETHKDKNGMLSEADDAVYSKMEVDFNQMTNEISRMQRRESMEAEMNKAVSSPLTSKPMMESNEDSKRGRASKEYKKAVFDAIRSNFRVISNVLSEGTDANGGYLVPEETDSQILQKLTEDNIFRKYANKITTSGEHKINIGATNPAASWIEEGGTLKFGDATFQQVLLDAHKLHVAVKVTDELLYDNAFNLEGYLTEQFAKALGNAEEDAFINGNGLGKPLGILAETGGAEVGVTTASSTAITADEIINLIYSLKRPYRKNAIFMCNDNTLLAIRKLKDSNGNYLWQPSIKDGEPDRLLGYPIASTSYFPTIEAGKKVLAFGDFSYYTIGDRGVRSFDQLKELFAGNGMVAFLAKERVDGKLVLPEAIKVLQMKGTAVEATKA